jgi:hypothetical protein
LSLTLASTSSTNLQLNFYGAAGVTYHIESATNLPTGPWSILNTLGPLSISGAQLYDYNRAADPAAQRYFRVRVTP